MTDAFHPLVLEDALNVALAHVDTRRWGMACRVFAWIRTSAAHSRDGWAAARLDQLAELIGTDRRYVDKLLRRMTLGERCLVREQPFGTRTGRAPARYAPNPRLTEWLVPWTRPREIVLGRLGYQRGLDSFVLARSYSAPQPGFVARFEGGFSRHTDEPVARFEGGFSRHNDSLVARYGNAPQSAGSAAPTPFSYREISLSALEAGDREGIQSVVAALLPRCKDGSVYGGLLADVCAAARAFPVEDLVRAIEAAPPELGGPKAMQFAVDQVRIGAPRPAAAPTAADRELEQRRRQLEARVAGYRAAGEEPPESVLIDLATCQNGGGGSHPTTQQIDYGESL